MAYEFRVVDKMADIANVERGDEIGQPQGQRSRLQQNIVRLDAAVGNAGIVYRLQRIGQGTGQRKKIVEIEFVLLFRPTVQRLSGEPGLNDKLLVAVGLQGERRTNPRIVQHF